MTVKKRSDPKLITAEMILPYKEGKYSIAAAAEKLGISRSAFAKRLQELGISFSKAKFDKNKYLTLKASGLKDVEIAKELNMTPHSLYCAKKNNRLYTERRNWETISKRKLTQLYVTEKLPIEEVTATLNKGYTSVYAAIKKYKITLRREDGASISETKLKTFLDQKLSIESISEQTNTTVDAVKRAIVRYSLDKNELFDEDGNSLNRITEDQKQVIYGGLMGDQSLSRLEDNRNVRMKVEHSLKQKEYVDYKYRILNHLVSENSYHEGERYDKRTDKIYEYVTFRLKRSKMLTDLHPLLYNPKKYVNGDILYEIEPLGLAIWFMDDGYKANNNQLLLCTDSFEWPDIERIKIYFFVKYDIKVEAVIRSGNRRILFRGINALLFQNLIIDHIIPMFEYKLIDKNYVDKLTCTSQVKGI